jgi:hypothetical protein
MTFADATPDGPNESGQASVARRFHGQISDAGGTLGSPILLQEAMVGTASGLINVTMGNDVTFLDGQTKLEKEAELSNFLAADAMQWLLPFGESVDLSFAWSLGSASFDRTVALDLTGALRADEQQVVPEPSTLTLLCLAVALLGGLRFHAGRIRATATA